MIDITKKPDILRIAKASGKIKLKKSTIDLIKRGKMEKGNVIEAAKISAIIAVKKTPELIPYCHQVPITAIDVNFEILSNAIKVIVTVKATAKTGVEMESLLGTSAALLTIWDMVKKYEKNESGQYPSTVITDIKVLKKIKTNR